MGALGRMSWRMWGGNKTWLMKGGMLVPALTREERERAAILSELQVLTNINAANSLLRQSEANLKNAENHANHVEEAVPIVPHEMTERLFQIRVSLSVLSDQIHDHLMKR